MVEKLNCKKCGVELTKKTANLGSFSNYMCRKCKSEYTVEHKKELFNKLPEE